MVDEKILTINLKKRIVNGPKWRRSSYGMRIIRELVKKHSKVENVKIDKSLNEKIWSKSVQNPPTIFRLKILKVDDKTVKAELLEK